MPTDGRRSRAGRHRGILYLNAVLLLVMLPLMRRLGRDRELRGRHALGRAGRISTGVALAAIAASVLALAVLSLA